MIQTEQTTENPAPYGFYRRSAKINPHWGLIKELRSKSIAWTKIARAVAEAGGSINPHTIQNYYGHQMRHEAKAARKEQEEADLGAAAARDRAAFDEAMKNR